MAEIYDILKIGKEKYLKENLQQEFYEQIKMFSGRTTSFQCKKEYGTKRYEIKTFKLYLDMHREERKYPIDEKDGEFIVKYGLKPYLILQALPYRDKEDFLIEFKERLNQLISKVRKEDYDENRAFYEEVHLMDNMILDIEDPVHDQEGLIRLGSMAYNDKEKEFAKKYGDEFLADWKSFRNKQKEDYKKIENYYTIYEDLYNNHFEDLKLYALMFRNVWLGNYYSDPLSVIYFSENYNNIVGYKEKLKTQNTPKSQITFLYYENEALFPYICSEYAQVCFSRNTQTVPIINALNIFQSEIMPQVFSIDNMTEEQCQAILDKMDNLKEKYLSIYDKCAKSEVNICYNKIQFTQEVYIPILAGVNYYFSGLSIEKRNYYSKSFEKKRLFRFLLKKYNKKDNVKDEVQNIKSILNSYVKQVNDRLQELYCQISNLSNKIHAIKENIQTQERYCELKANGYDYFSIRDYEINQELERKKREITNNFIKWKNEQNKKIQEYDNIINGIREQIETTKEHFDSEITKLLKETSLWNFVYNNQKEIIYFINNCNIRAYYICWIKMPNKMRKIDKDESIAPNFNLHYRYLFSNGTNNIHISYSHLIQLWIENIKLEEKKKLELEKQEEEARKEKFRFNQKNTHPLDSNISFHASDHTYIVNGIHLKSVTTFVNNAFPKFDVEVHAKQKAEKLGISMQEVIEMWEQKGKESRDLGTIMHQKIENYFKGIDSPNDEAFMLFKTFANNFKLSPYRTEWSVYDWDYKIAGTIDFVDYQNGEFSIYDWKRSDKIIANGLPIKNNKYGEKGIYPLENLDNSPYYHYALQLSLYKFILERNYNIKVSKLRLGIFHPSYNKPYILEMPYLEKELNSIFNLHSEIIF